MSTLTIILIVVAAILLILAIIIIIAVKSAKPHENSLWRDRKRNCLGLPWTFTVYELSDDRFFVTSGFLNIRDEEIRLYRIIDITYSASMMQRLFGMGTITLNTSDKSSGVLVVKNVKHARDTKELIAKNIEAQRDKKRVISRELMGAGDDNDFDTMNDA